MAIARGQQMRFDLPTMEEIRGVTADPAAGIPMVLPVQDIDEDPDQPRLEFDDEPLKELAATIAARGIRSPVSVRPHPRDPGRWILNYGARRLRAAKLAELGTVPAFVDKAADSYDQVIENEQREGLKPLELALFVKRELEKGVSQAEIARRLGKSQTYITFVRAMIDPPAWLMDVYRSGRCRNAAQLYELRRLHEADPERVEERLEGQGRIRSSDVERLKRGDDAGEVAAIGERLLRPDIEGKVPGARQRLEPSEHAIRPPERSQDVLVLTAKFKGLEVRVQFDARPPKGSSVYVTNLATGGRTVADIDALSELKLARSTTRAAQ